MTGPITLKRWSVVLESPDADRLARFYLRLLGWTYRSQDGDWVTIGPRCGGEELGGPDYLGFNTSPEYRRPVWPPADGEQQMLQHLDFCVGAGLEALAEAVETARAAGALEAEFQPQDDVRVMLDPDGHPFCLYVDPSRLPSISAVIKEACAAPSGRRSGTRRPSRPRDRAACDRFARPRGRTPSSPGG